VLPRGLHYLDSDAESFSWCTLRRVGYEAEICSQWPGPTPALRLTEVSWRFLAAPEAVPTHELQAVPMPSSTDMARRCVDVQKHKRDAFVIEQIEELHKFPDAAPEARGLGHAPQRTQGGAT
jgi:hypothetical protein